MRFRIVAVLCVLLTIPCVLPAQDSKENSDFKLAVSLYNDKLYDLSLEQFRQFTNLYPNSSQGVEARFYVGLIQLKLKHYDDARYSFQNFALSYPEDIKAPEAWMNVAEAYLALNNFTEAALAFERVKTFHPKSKQAPAALLKASELYEKANDRESAKRVLRVLTQEYESPAMVLPGRLRYAAILLADGDYEGARAESKKVSDATKDVELRSLALLYSAQSLLRLGRNQETESTLNEIITKYKSTPAYYQGLFLLGVLREGAGNLVDATATWRILADDSVGTPRQIRQDALVELGEAGALDRNYQISLKSFERAAAIDASRTGEAWYRAGEMAERTGNTKKMAEYFGRAVADSNSALDRRAIIIGGMKSAKVTKNYLDFVRLALAYNNAYPKDGNLPKVLFEAAEVYAIDLKEYSRATGLYQDILDKFPQSLFADDALFGLGKALRLSDRLDESLRVLESLEKQYPSSGLIERARAEAEYIRLFELKNKESGLEKLALLVGDVIAQQSKGDLSYRLAEIYFHELKDYTQAAVQYQFALNADLDVHRRPSAWMNLARSFEYLSLKDRLEKNTKLTGTYADRAVAVYDSLLRKFPGNEYYDDAALARFNIRVQSAASGAELRKLGTDFLNDVSITRFKDRALLVLANAYQSSRNLEDAALSYKLILDQYRQSESAAEALFQLGKSLLGLADRDSAAVILAQFLERNPNHLRSAEAAFLLAQHESAAGHPERANTLYDLIEKKFYYTDFCLGLSGRRGDAYFNGRNYAKAIEMYGKQVQLTHTDYFTLSDIPADLIFRLAYSNEKLSNRSEAKRYYIEYAARAPGSDTLSQVYYSLSSIARSENNTELASKYLQESIRHAPASSEQSTTLSLEAAELLFKDERYADAIPRYGEVAQQAKNDSVKQFLQARVIVSYYRLDNVKEADKRSATFVKTFPNSVSYAAEFEFERGKYFLRKDDGTKAIARFENVVQQYPKAPIVPEALFWTGRAFELSEKPQQAIQLYDSIVHFYPKSDILAKAELNLGNAYYNLEQWDAAVRNYKDIVDNESRSPELVKFALNNLAMAYKQLKLYDAAMELDRKFIERYPDDPDIIDKKIDVGVLYKNLGYYDQSIIQLQSLLEAGNPDIEAELRYYIGEAYFYKGDHQQAILEFLKVPYLVTKRGKADWVSTSYYMAGQSYEKMSKFDLAMMMYKKIIESKETDTDFKTAAQREIDRVQSLVGKKN